MLSGLPFQLTFWNTVDVAAFPDPAASTVLRSGVVCRNVMPSSRSCTLRTVCPGVRSRILWQVVELFGHSRWRVWC